MHSPFYHYNAQFDAVELIYKSANKNIKPSKKFFTNYIGLKINPDFMPECVRDRVGTIEQVPIPANWHTDIAELGAVMRALDLTSNDQFVMGEMGCGWGCWMGISGLVAKQRGMSVKLYGIEGDKKHIAWAKESMANNGFLEKEYNIIEGVASANYGTALFPIMDKGMIHYGLEPVFNASESDIKNAIQKKSHDVLPMIPLEQIFEVESRVDLLHVDIQGGEVDLISGSLDYLCKKVAYLVVGTHSRPIEGELIKILTKQGFYLEIERPAILKFDDDNKIFTAVDGVQGWRNSRLLPLPEVVKATCKGRDLQIMLEGWSKKETSYRWSAAKKCSVRFNLEDNEFDCKKLEIKGFSLGKQHVEIELNGIKVFDELLSGDEINHTISLTKGTLSKCENTLYFFLPDARIPGNGDTRLLAFALEKITIF